MKNVQSWKPTKFIETRRGLRASRNPKHVARCSRLVADRVAQVCERAINMYATGKLLDLGCGHVPLFATYRGRVSESVCVDWGSSVHQNVFLDHVMDLTQPLKLESSYFDTVLMTDVLEHIPEPAMLMDEIARILRPGGKLIMTVPFFYWLHEEPHDYHRYTRFALERLCRNAGLNVLELAPYGGLPEILFDLAAKSGESLPAGGLITRVFSTLAGITKLRIVRRLSASTANSFPLGYCLVASL